MDDACTPVTYEACADFRASDDDAEICGCCGWAELDHVTVVIELTGAAAPLRQAS